MKNNNNNYGYIGPEQTNGCFSMKKGQVISGYPVGILLLNVWYPILPGNVVNAYTYDFPVRMKLVPGATQPRMHTGDPTLLDDLIKAGKELEMDGVRAVVGACGYFGHFQRKLAAALDVPVFLSSLVQIPMIKMSLKAKQKIGILCADEENLTSSLLKECGVDDTNICVIKGLGKEPEFSAFLYSDKGYFDNSRIKTEVVGAAQRLVAENPEVGAILLECSDMPPYAADIQRMVNLPVFDFISMINWIKYAVVQKQYYGYI
jgi:hypothetical protein